MVLKQSLQGQKSAQLHLLYLQLIRVYSNISDFFGELKFYKFQISSLAL